MTTPDPKALRAIARDATQEWSAKVSEIHEGAEGDAYGFAAFGPTHDYEGDEERHEEAQDQAEADARYIAAVSPPVVLALLDRIEAAEASLNCYATNSRALLAAVEENTAEAVAQTRRAETAERERDEARAALIRSQEDHRAAVEALETYEERIGDIADHVLGLVPPDVPSIVKLDAIERRCGEERVAARQAERERDEARAALNAAWKAAATPVRGMVAEVVGMLRTTRDEYRAAAEVDQRERAISDSLQAIAREDLRAAVARAEAAEARARALRYKLAKARGGLSLQDPLFAATSDDGDEWPTDDELAALAARGKDGGA